MALRFGCYDQAGDIVFGPRHQCTAKPALTTPADLPRLIPSWRFVVPETSEGVAADNLQQQLDELEPRYLETLDVDERGDR
jgi:hypothetical protein